MNKYFIFKHINWLFIAVFLFTIICIILNNKRKEIIFRDKEAYYQTIISLSYETFHKKINPDYIQSIYPDPSVTFNLQDTCKKFIVLVPPNPCSDCMKNALGFVEHITSKIGKDKVAFLTQFKKNKDSKIWRNIWNIDFQVYNNSGRELFSPIIEQQFFTLFTIDSTMQPQHVFIPSEQLPQMNEEYFQYILSIFNSD